MDDRLIGLLEKLQHVENEVLHEIQRKEQEFFYQILKKKVRFEQDAKKAHKDLIKKIHHCDVHYLSRHSKCPVYL